MSRDSLGWGWGIKVEVFIKIGNQVHPINLKQKKASLRVWLCVITIATKRFDPLNEILYPGFWAQNLGRGFVMEKIA